MWLLFEFYLSTDIDNIITICQTALIVNRALKTALQSMMTVDIAASTKNILCKAAHA